MTAPADTRDRDGTRPPMLPRASKGAVEAAAGSLVANIANGQPPVALVRARPEWDEADSIECEGRPVRIGTAGTVLAVLDLIDTYGSEPLLILTDLEESELGDSILAQVAHRRTESVDPIEAMREATGAERIDARLRGRDDAWIAEDLLGHVRELGFEEGQRRSILSRLDVLRRLLGFHLFGDAAKVIDTAAMFEWSRQDARLREWRSLDTGLRANLAEALEEIAGPAAGIIVRLTETGLAADALPIAMAASELLRSDDATVPLALLNERHFGRRHPEPYALERFAEAGRAYLDRRTESGADWIDKVYDQGEHLLQELGARSDFADSDTVSDGFVERLRAFGRVVAPAIGDRSRVGAVENALDALKEHRLAAGQSERIEAAESALRLLWWLGAPDAEPDGVAAWVDWQIREGGWVDRALAIVAADNEPVLRRAYDRLTRAVRRRRAEADAAFSKLAAAPNEKARRPLAVEEFHDRILRPLDHAKGGEMPPLIIACDGITAADAATIGEDIHATRAWVELGRSESGREGLLAAPSSTNPYSTAGLLTGQPVPADRDTERAGFAARWERRATHLFRASELRAVPAEAIPDHVRDALKASGAVVAIILEVGGGAEQRPPLRLADIGHLSVLLKAASREARPVVLAARARPDRTGGPLSEMVVPLQVYAPTQRLLPSKWTRFERAAVHEPAWWNGGVSGPEPAEPRRDDGDPGLFEVAGLGARVSRSEQFLRLRQGVPKAPDPERVAKVVNALAEAGGRLPSTRLADLIGLHPRRMSGFVSKLTQVLNVDGYAVIAERDGTRTVELDTELLKEQFRLQGEGW